MEILLVEDHALVREGIAHMLQCLDDNVHIWPIASGDEAIAQLARQTMDLVLLDLNLPGIDGFTTLNRMVKLAPATPVVILSAMDNPLARARCLKDGARAYMNKTISSDDMLHTLRCVLRGEHMATSSQASIEINQAEHITQRQRKILQMLQQGMRNKEIAYHLGISDATVKVHIREILRLLHVNNRYAAVCKADQLGLLV